MPDSGKPGVRKTRTGKLRTALLTAAVAAGALAGPAQPAAAATRSFDTCPQGYVWREAVPGDHVCVYPIRRRQARDDNRLAAGRSNGTGVWDCRKGFVWREAVPSDHVCVVPARRTETWHDNAQAAGRVREALLDTTSATATLPASALKGLVTKRFSELARGQNSDVGIRGRLGTISVVSDTSDGFKGPRNRVVRIGVHGFVSVSVVPDPEFYVELDLRIRSVPKDGGADIVAGLTHLRVHTSGFGHGTLLRKLRGAITDAFAQPVSFAHIPAGTDFVTAGVPLDASLKLYFENTVPGRVAAGITQRRLDDM